MYKNNTSWRRRVHKSHVDDVSQSVSTARKTHRNQST